MDTQIREIELSIPFERQLLADFLASHALKYENDIETAYGLFDEEEELVGCGCAAGKLLKCFAIDASLRGQNGLGVLVSRLIADRYRAGYTSLYIVTRPKNRELFAACRFFPLAETEDVILLASRPDVVNSYLSSLPRPPAGTEDIGAIVMNANPFTKGHLALVEHAAASCAFLYIFVVEEDRSLFPFRDRIELVRAAAAPFGNVCVCPSGEFMISGLTFPTYFLKETEDPSLIQSRLDITLFSRKIAPALGIKKRFAGQEPFDPVTAAYNRVMRELLPANGISFIEIPRREADGAAISASRVRSLLKEEGASERVLSLVPPATADYLRGHFPLR